MAATGTGYDWAAVPDSLAEEDCGLNSASADARAEAALVVAGLADPINIGSENQTVCFSRPRKL